MKLIINDDHFNWKVIDLTINDANFYFIEDDDFCRMVEGFCEGLYTDSSTPWDPDTIPSPDGFAAASFTAEEIQSELVWRTGKRGVSNA